MLRKKRKEEERRKQGNTMEEKGNGQSPKLRRN